VTVDELVRGVSMALGSLPVSACPAFDHNGSGEITIDELIAAQVVALNGCPASPGVAQGVAGLSRSGSPHPDPLPAGEGRRTNSAVRV